MPLTESDPGQPRGDMPLLVGVIGLLIIYVMSSWMSAPYLNQDGHPVITVQG
jgi:hypothetical protein